MLVINAVSCSCWHVLSFITRIKSQQTGFYEKHQVVLLVDWRVPCAVLGLISQQPSCLDICDNTRKKNILGSVVVCITIAPSRVVESKATFLKAKGVSLLCTPCRPVCPCLIGGRQAGKDHRVSCRRNCVTLSESDTSSILCIFLALVQHA